ncbi:LLM class F420-dependent oxidoreductase [Cryobacterium sp. BB736]|uniref:LLM class F420-dependent oxidoreductase n=1 Tax=Cryobacterium sp. BB736 TaxID=2746963 RepID=UPI0018762307|nr:LLM class F420-dependent oxidoreductase [Cryobacterium sp. BB736]
MDFRVFTEPQQGASYDDLLAVAQATERLGFDGFFRSDHFLSMGGDGLPGPTDAWTTLAGLARETSRIRLGTLVTSVTFRHPSILAIQVAGVDQMSGGRVELGLGTGWMEEEHTALGVPFPAKRFGMLEEQLELITGLWSTPVGDRFSYEGEHYRLQNAPGLPKPTQSSVPIIVGGGGPKRTPALAARFATEYNSVFVDLAEHRARMARVRQASEAAEREVPILSIGGTIAVGASTADAQRRAEAIGRDLDRMRPTGIVGTPIEVVDRLGAFAELGVTRVYLQLLDLQDLDQLEFFATEIVPQVG